LINTKLSGYYLLITDMNTKASFRNIARQTAGHRTPFILSFIILRFAGLFNLPIPLHFAFGIGVSQ